MFMGLDEETGGATEDEEGGIGGTEDAVIALEEMLLAFPPGLAPPQAERAAINPVRKNITK